MATTTVLLADIGGTNARFALGGARGAGDVSYLAVSDFVSFDEALARFLALRGLAEPPRAAAIAVAGPVANGEGGLTNGHWRLSKVAIQARFGIPGVRILNDFEALAWGVPLLHGEHLTPLTGRHAAGAARGPSSLARGAIGNGRMVVLGPGTGLGVACYTPTPDGAMVLASEGGHVNAPSWNARSDAIIDWLRGEFGHVSVERMVSGQGIENTYRAIAALDGLPARLHTAAEITGAALAGGDSIARETVELFCAMLGETAGNLALTFGATGGVYVAGGIGPRIVSILQASAFRERFESRGRFRSLLETVPAWLITHPDATFLGLEAVATRAVV